MTDAATRAAERTRFVVLLGGLGLAVLAAAVVFWPGCRTHPPLSSEEGHKILLRLNTATSSEDPDALARAERASHAALSSGRISADEHAAFARVVATARAGDWEAAHADVQKFLADQVFNPGVGRPDDAGHDHAGHDHDRP